MAGHNKWSKIKRKKAVKDARQSKIWSKLIREITVAAREGGGNPEGNPRLRNAISNARANNMPNDVIERAIARGTGAEIGAAGVRRDRLRGLRTGRGGLLRPGGHRQPKTARPLRFATCSPSTAAIWADPNSVAWMFEKKGSILIPAKGVDEDALILAALEAGAEDVSQDEGYYEVVTDPEAFNEVRNALEKAGFPIESAEVQFVPLSTVKVEGKEAEQVIRLLEALDELDDVTHVASNFDMDEEVMARIEAA
ncbi:MAG: putative transcriptional regulatory protein [Candidatus Poribacteria bacterium]|nr:MAG: putative transcriptional regulatory protein [Candidatus Poribacteria bacterium]